MLKAALLKIEREFPASAIQSGYQYFVLGNVLSVKLSEGLLLGRVKGQSGRIYNVHVDLKSWPSVRERCDCQQKYKCKHTVACFLSLQSRANLTIIKPNMPVVKSKNQDEQIMPDDEVISADNVTWYSDYVENSNVSRKEDVESLSIKGHLGYQLGIIVDGKPVSILPLIVHYLQKLDSQNLDSIADSYLVNLKFEENKWLQVSFGRIKPLLSLLLTYGFSKVLDGNRLTIPQYQLSLMREAELAILATKSRWRGTFSFNEKLSNLVDKNIPVISIPNGLNTNLRDYQHFGLNWLQFLKNNHFSGILADDMGLGKTVQALANLQCEKENGNLQTASLIVAPTSLVGNWLAEASRFTPGLKVLVFHGFDRFNYNFSDYDVIISTYGLVQRDKERFLAYEFYYLILDEAQFIKNSRAKTTKIIQQLRAKYRVCLTGTPLENHLGELWSLFNFLMPGLLGDNKFFRQFFRIPIERDNDLAKKEILAGRIRPFMLRRTKTEVMQELPSKTEIMNLVELSGPQRDLYEAIRLTLEEKVRNAIREQGIGKSQILILDALLKLRQVCCDPKLLSIKEAEIAYEHSAKLDALMDLLDNLIEEDRRVLVFSQFTSMLKIIESKLEKKKFGYLKLTGETRNRQDLVDRFQNGEEPIFLISLKAGGTGLNLTRADTVILYDPWWNPAVQEQAAGRSHRIGQKNPVFIYKLIVKGSIEEVIMSIQEKKHDLYNAVLAGHNQMQSYITAEDVARFFSPLD